jgi:hypothetical protein
MSLRHLFLHNLAWKLVSIILAILVWFTLQSGIQRQLRPTDLRTFSKLEITVMTTAGDERIFRVEPSRVSVSVSGDSTVVRSLRRTDVQVFVNLTESVEAKVLRKRIQVYVPPGVNVAEIDPPEVSVQSAALAAPGLRPSKP